MEPDLDEVEAEAPAIEIKPQQAHESRQEQRYVTARGEANQETGEFQDYYLEGDR